MDPNNPVPVVVTSAVDVFVPNPGAVPPVPNSPVPVFVAGLFVFPAPNAFEGFVVVDVPKIFELGAVVAGVVLHPSGFAAKIE